MFIKHKIYYCPLLTYTKLIGNVNLSSTEATKYYFNIDYDLVAELLNKVKEEYNGEQKIKIVSSLRELSERNQEIIEQLTIKELLKAKLPPEKDVSSLILNVLF